MNTSASTSCPRPSQHCPAIWPVFLVLLWLLPVGSALADSDDFNDNSRNTARWGSSDIGVPGGLVEANQRLEYRNATSSDSYTAWGWQTLLPFGQDWETRVKVNVPALTFSTDGYAGVGLYILNGADATDMVALEFTTGRDFGSGYREFLSLLNVNGVDNPALDLSTATASTSATFRARWVASTARLLLEYDADGPANGESWTTLRTFDPAATWGMTSGNFQVGIGGYSGGRVVASSDGVSLDDFTGAVGSPDVASYLVSKTQEYLQTGTGAPTLQTNNPFFFNASANTPVATNTLISGSVRIPGGETRAFTNVFFDGNSFSEGFASQAAMDAVYNNGTYTMSLSTVHDGSLTNLVLNLTGNAYPNAPRVSNFTVAQTVNATANFTVTWDAFIGGTTNDFMQLDVRGTNGTVFRTPSPGSAGVLDGTATSAVIPAGTLTAGQTYTARLRFAKAVARDTGSYLGSLGLALYSIRTSFSLVTAGAGQPPAITVQPQNQTVLAGANATFSVTATGTAPLAYQWRSNGVNIASATNASRTLTNTQPAWSGSGYTVVITNANGSVTSAVAALTVVVPPSITAQPQSQTVFTGTNVSFTVTATGTAPLAYQWRKDGTNVGSATNASYILSSVTTGHSGSYTVVVTNAYGSVTSAVATLTVLVPADPLPAGVFPLATNSGVEFSYSSAFDGTNYLVVIQGDLVGTSPDRFNLEAQRLSRTGALLGPKISLGLTDSEPFVAFDGTNYLVVSELRDAGGADGIYGRFVNPLGNPVGTTFTISHGTGSRNPDTVIFGTTNYLVIWTDGRREGSGPGDQDVYAQRVSTTGQLLGGELKISGAAGDGPAAAFDGSNFLVIWREDVNDTDIYGRLVSPSGTFVTGELVIDSNALPSDNPGAVIYDGTRYVVLINDQVGGLDNEWDLFARFVTTAGSVLSNRVTITDAPGGQRIPSLASDGSNYLVSWSDGLGMTNSNIKFKFFNLAGQPMSSEFAVFSAQGANLPIVARILFDGRQFVAIGNVGAEDTNGNITACDVYGAFISPFPSGTFPIAVTSDNEFGGDAAFDGTNYLVSMGGGPWSSGEITAQLISADGALMGNKIFPGRFGSFPKLAFDGTNYLMIWQDSANSPGDDIYGQRIGQSGALLGTPFAIGTAAGRQNLESFNHLVFGGGNYLAVWGDDRNGDTNGDIYAQRISPAGVLVGAEIPIATGTLNERVPAAAFDGTNYLVVWQSRRSGSTEMWDTYGKFISKAGVSGGAFLISQKPSSSYNPTSVAFDGANYFVVWARDIGPGYPSPTDWDIYARIVTRSGTFIGQEFAVTTAAGSQPFASVIHAGTGFLVTWLDEASGSSRNRFFGRLGAPLTAEFSLFGSQGARFPLGSFLFDGSRLFAGVTYVDGMFGNGDIYGLFASSLDIPVPLAITEQPESQFVAVGRALSLRVSVVGLEPLSYQWRFNGTNIPGATSASLVYFNALANFSGDYTVVVANYAGSVTSAPATVVVIGAPGIVTAPVNQVVVRGGSATFSVTASGVPPIRYQWRLNGVNLAGATNSTLTLLNVQNTNAGIYSVVVANLAGATVTSAKLLVGGGASLLRDNFASRITTNSVTGEIEGSTVLATRESGEPDHAGQPGGKSVWIAWTAPGSGPVTFKTEGSGFDTLLAVYTGTSVASLTEVASNDDASGFFASAVTFFATGGVTYQIAVDGFGGASGDVELAWVFEPGPDEVPRFVTQPQSQTVTNGATVQFTATVAGVVSSHLVYQWFHKGQPVPGANTPSLTIANVQPENVGAYLLRVGNTVSGRFFLSEVVILELQHIVVGQPPDNTRRSHDKFQNLFVQGSVSGASGLAAALKPKPAFVTVSAGALGTQIFDNFGATTEAGEPVIAGVIGGASRWFGIQAAASGTMAVDTIGSDFDTILGVYVGNDLLTLVEVASDDNSAPDGIRSRVSFTATNGTTYLVLVDGVNGAQGTITLNWSLGTAPQITQTPGGASVPAGGSVTVSVAASGTPAPAYQWRLNGAAIPGATGASLTVNDFQFDDEGSYSVVASNSVGLATSPSAFLALDVPAQLGQVFKTSGGGPFQLHLTGTARQNYVIQSTTNLLFTNTAWSSLIVTSSFTGVFDYIDNGATNSPRFYRAVKQ